MTACFNLAGLCEQSMYNMFDTNKDMCHKKVERENNKVQRTKSASIHELDRYKWNSLPIAPNCGRTSTRSVWDKNDPKNHR